MMPRLFALLLCMLVLPLPASELAPRWADMVDAHNALRRPLGLPPLRWSPTAAEQAQGWADTLASQGCPARYNPDPERRRRYGENVLRAYAAAPYEGSLRQAAAVVARWAVDGQDYDPQSGVCRNPGGTRCGQYLAIIGEESRGIGCGFARCPSAEIWVCNYFPRSRPPPPRPAATPAAAP
jgi:hypothetical protein